MTHAPLTLDWTPLLGMTGVFLHTYLQDLAAHARTRRPLLVPPAAPPPAVLQVRLGLTEPWQILGPLYLLTSVGLRAPAAWVPSAGSTATATPTACLDRPVLDRLLIALLPALDPTHLLHVEADAAVRVLAEGGILADTEPADLFYTDGVWPQLLPLLIADDRWVRLFTALHGAETLRAYRRKALTWVDTARHMQARRDQEQAALAAYLLAAQRQDGSEDGGSAAPAADGGQRNGAGSAVGAVAISPVAEEQPAAPADTGTPSDHDTSRRYIPTISARSAPVARDSEQPATSSTLSLPDRAGVAPGSPSAATRCFQRPQEPFVLLSLPDRGVSLPDRSLTGDSLTTQDSRNDTNTGTPSDRITSDIRSLVERHLREAECFSTRQDATFWSEVNHILTGSATRYPHTPGEKKAAERHFKRQQIPIGVVLAALRAAMMLPARPRTFAEALIFAPFQAAVEHALTRLPVPSHSDWHAFLHAYRQIGRGDRLRDVPPADYLTLQGMFAGQPDRCRQVIERWMEVPPPRVSPATLRRALIQASGVQPALPWTAPPAHAADDPRRALLVQAGLSPKLLTSGMTEAYLHAWIAEADARAADLTNRLGWLTWGIRSGQWPQDHPQLQARRAPQRPTPPPPPPPPPAPLSAEQQAWQAVWSAVQTRLAANLPAQDYATWLHETALLDLEAGQAIVGTPNIFARDKVAAQYAPLIAQALEQQTCQPVHVQVVLDQACASYGGRV